MNKVRGFEKVMYSQFRKDFVNEFHNEDETFITEAYNISTPKRATAHSSGYDIYSTVDFILKPNQDIKIPTGFKSYMLPDEWLMIMPRSGLGFKYYTRLANTIGNGDSDYYDNVDNEGHYWVKIRNEGDKEISIKKGEAFAQCVFMKYYLADGDDFIGNERVGGLGSTNA